MIILSGSEESQFLLQCTNFTQQQLESINLARGVCGLGCLLTASFVLLLLLLSKAYKTTLQRLFIYLTVMTVLLETCLSVQLEHYFQYSHQETFCEVLGFFSEYIGSVTYTFTNEISIYLVYVVYSTLKGKTISQSETGCLSKSLELVLVSIAVIFPLLYTWVPFIDGNYGLNGATCWIETLDKNCMYSGLKDQLVIMSVRYIVYAVIIMATIALVIVYCRMAYKIQTPQIRKLLRQTLLLSITIVVSITILTLLSLAYVIASFTMKHHIYGLWLANAAGIPFSMLLVPVIFLFYVRNVNAQADISCTRCCRSKSHSGQSGTPFQMEDMVVKSEFPQSNPTSTRQSVPSFTHYNIDYTGEFTVITMSAAMPRNEGAPLVNANPPTGYNAVDRNAV